MPQKDQTILALAQKSRQSAEKARWWISGIDRETARNLGIADMIRRTLFLLDEIDDITMDIQIIIKQKH